MCGEGEWGGGGGVGGGFRNLGCECRARRSWRRRRSWTIRPVWGGEPSGVLGVVSSKAAVAKEAELDGEAGVGCAWGGDCRGLVCECRPRRCDDVEAWGLVGLRECGARFARGQVVTGAGVEA
eukprot:359621-Chlamydomonas_euryale.AAC.1